MALACFGGGSMMAALLLPKVLDRVLDRAVMLSAAGLLAAALLYFAQLVSTSVATKRVWPSLLSTWAVLGVAHSAVMTPSGRLLRRSAHAADPPAVFAAQFALSHAWLLTYPLAGWLARLGGRIGFNIAGARRDHAIRRSARPNGVAGVGRRRGPVSPSRSAVGPSSPAWRKRGTCARVCDRRSTSPMAPITRARRLTGRGGSG
ncbi:MAG: transporter [Rhizorhabdus sp.]|nr:transporter [Rhizorhabdus sp.]